MSSLAAFFKELAVGGILNFALWFLVFSLWFKYG
jgi:hypothetical protein